MVNKEFKVGQQWRCRDGSRAAIVAFRNGCPVVWVEGRDATIGLNINGAGYEYSLDLIEPWVERRTMEAEVLMYLDGPYLLVSMVDPPPRPYPRPQSIKILARKKIMIVEGEGM